MRKPVSRFNYVATMELALIVALGIAITAANLNIEGPDAPVIKVQPREVIEIEDIPQVEWQKKAPPPARPAIPVVVADDQVLDSEELHLDPLQYEAPIEIGPLPTEPTQPSEPDEPVVFIVVEEDPEPVGGLAALQRQIRYPELARKAGVEGRVFLQFVVDEEGFVSDVVVLKGIGAGCNEEAVRVLSEARFTPGKQRGRAVRVRMSLPISFRLR